MAQLVSRRYIAAAVAALLALGAVSSCASPAPSGTDSASAAASSSVTASADNPFGLKDGSVIDAVVFDGGYKTDYVDFAGQVLQKKFPGVTVNVTASTEISAEMQPRFVGGNPPDLLDNQGAQTIPMTSIISQLATWDNLWAANTYEGVPIKDAVLSGVKETGTYDGRFLVMPYVMTVWAFYYSQSLFDANGWTPPKTWDDALTLCDQAKAKDLYLFTWGKEAASYWKYLAMDSANKQGGSDVTQNIINLKPGAWSDPTMKAVLDKFKAVVDKGCFIPGGAGTQFTQAQAQWSNDQKALMYFTGSWIENEMAKATADNFKMTAWPALVLDEATAKVPFAAVDAGASENFVLPAQGANVAGAQELMRAMLSKEAASNFAKSRLAPTIVKDTVPADGFGSTALASTSALLETSGDNTFTWAATNYDNYYGIATDSLVLWNSFLSGEKSVDDLIKGEEDLNAKAAANTDIPKMTWNV
ncbi:MAG: N-acetylglucosamine/diacetylchitobiose ABC transporter substrate-binding protein [Propionibacteriaceae bacterium]|jgi:N-acetylglucosamine transport system substrate-binding protein|nr:N-acetylglucosamine/diacetylchitobiose ABC transporter substrate-binding protein [Propionibacteriaceae bacterium]